MGLLQECYFHFLLLWNFLNMILSYGIIRHLHALSSNLAMTDVYSLSCRGENLNESFFFALLHYISWVLLSVLHKECQVGDGCCQKRSDKATIHLKKGTMLSIVRKKRDHRILDPLIFWAKFGKKEKIWKNRRNSEKYFLGKFFWKIRKKIGKYEKNSEKYFEKFGKIV